MEITIVTPMGTERQINISLITETYTNQNGFFINTLDDTIEVTGADYKRILDIIYADTPEESE